MASNANNPMKVELALLDDINTNWDKAFSNGDVMSPLIKLETQVKNSIKDFQMVEKMIIDGIQKAKDLGATALVDELTKRLSNTRGAMSLRTNTLKHITNAISSI
jgi:hypothetical protein